MQIPPLPEEESERQKTLDKTGLLNSGSEARFDRITRLAQQIFSVPIALISLVDRDRQWFKSRQGLDAQQTPREISFCGHAILNSEVFVIENALVDQRFCDNPLVMGAPDIRFYAGAPLHSTKGYRIGTLCLIDSQPRSFSSKQRSMLKDLAATIEALIQAEELSNERLGKLTAQLPGVVYQFQRFASGKITFPFSSPQILDLYGITPEQAAQDASPAFERIHPDDLQAIS
ncbi:MAG: GAF domain-containing protein, partial [Vibrio metschnikovii]